MQKHIAKLLALLLALLLLAACNEPQEYQDGTYHAEFKDFDSEGYKDTLEITVENHKVTALVYDAYNESGELKSLNDDYRQRMESQQGTYPAKYASDLINQYLATHDLDKVDVVAGATESSEAFLALFHALEESMYKGDTSTLVVENLRYDQQ